MLYLDGRLSGSGWPVAGSWGWCGLDGRMGPRLRGDAAARSARLGSGVGGSLYGGGIAATAHLLGWWKHPATSSPWGCSWGLRCVWGLGTGPQCWPRCLVRGSWSSAGRSPRGLGVPSPLRGLVAGAWWRPAAVFWVALTDPLGPEIVGFRNWILRVLTLLCLSYPLGCEMNARVYRITRSGSFPAYISWPG